MQSHLLTFLLHLPLVGTKIAIETATETETAIAIAIATVIATAVHALVLDLGGKIETETGIAAAAVEIDAGAAHPGGARAALLRQRRRSARRVTGMLHPTRSLQQASP